MDLAVAIYRATQKFPREELFGITSQMRRSSSSVPYNIAEGWGKDTTAQYIHGLQIAQGSLKELESQVTMACRLGFLSETQEGEFLATCDAEGRMLRALVRSLQESDDCPPG